MNQSELSSVRHPWQTCPICRNIPPRAHALYKSSEMLDNTFPPEADQLSVVGAPFYNTDTTSANHCLMKCPQCGTLYAWEFTYEYLVNGTEDEYILTRLSPAEGKDREKVVLAKCKQLLRAQRETTRVKGTS